MLTSSASRDYNQWHKAQQPRVVVQRMCALDSFCLQWPKLIATVCTGCVGPRPSTRSLLWQSGKWTVAHNLDSVAAQLRGLCAWCRSQTQIYRVQHMGGFPINAILRMWHMLGQVLLLMLLLPPVCLTRCLSVAVSAMHGNELAKSGFVKQLIAANRHLSVRWLGQ